MQGFRAGKNQNRDLWAAIVSNKGSGMADKEQASAGKSLTGAPMLETGKGED